LLAIRGISRAGRISALQRATRARNASEEEGAMSKKLFVGGLSWGTTDLGLREAFERFGAVAEAKVILDRDTGRSRGFGFVTFDDDSAAESAVASMDGAELDGRTVRVNEAHERAPRGPGGPPGRGNGHRDRGRRGDRR
jgi:cold-inducible RNA-binding protein